MSLLWDSESRERRVMLLRVKWPQPPVGYVNLAQATDDVGAILFPDGWSLLDLWLPREMVPHIASSAGRRLDNDRGGLFERMYADQALRRHGYERPSEEATPAIVETACREGVHPDDHASLTFSEEEWLIAVELLKQEDLHTLLAFKRSRRVQRLIAEAAERGDVVISYRHHKGGLTHPIEAHWWSMPDLAGRFPHFSINPDDPFSSTPPEWADRHDLFIHDSEAAKLTAIARSSADTAAAAATLPTDVPADIYLSPYLLLAFDVIRDTQITETNHSNVAFLTKRIRAAMVARGLRDSQVLAENIAKMIRHPDAQLGKANKRPGSLAEWVTPKG